MLYTIIMLSVTPEESFSLLFDDVLNVASADAEDTAADVSSIRVAMRNQTISEERRVNKVKFSPRRLSSDSRGT